MKNAIALLTAALLLSACTGGAKPVDGKKFLAGLDGPKVPTMQDSLTESAKAAEKQGNYKQAIMLYQQVLEKKPDDKDIILALADDYRRSGQYDQAIAVYDNLLAKDPASLDAKEGKGLALISKGDFDTPTALFEEVMKADPKRWKTLNGLGILFATRNLNNEAQTYFEEALKFNPDSPSVLNNAGLSQALGGRYDTALASLTRAAALAPAGSAELKRINLNTAAVYAISGKLDEAKAIAEKYYSGAALNNNMGMYAHLAKDDQLAKTYLNMALTDSKTYYPKAWENLQAISGESSDTIASPGAAAAVAAPAAVVKEQKPASEPAARALPAMPLPPTE